MRLPDDPTKFSNRWKYIELAAWRYNAKMGKYTVVREMTGPKDNRQPVIVEWKDVAQYQEQNQNTGIYTSVFNYDSKDHTRATRLGSLYFDFDSSDGEEARADAIKLAEFLYTLAPEESVRIYFTGKKGFHIELEALAAGITGSSELPDVFRFVANDLKEKLSLSTIDFAVYDQRRMWRLPNSIHQDTGLYKRALRLQDLRGSLESIQKLATAPCLDPIPEQKFCMEANEWYREYSYKFEAAKQPKFYTSEEIFERFKTHGTGMLRAEGEKQFDPMDLFENCHAINDLWRKAETTHDLTHEERLFLCSILTYTDEAIYYLHEILKNTQDYNFERSQAHIDDWIRRRELGIGGRPYSCERANSAGVGCGDCNLEPRKKWAKIGDNWIETDEESLPSPIRFAYKRK